MSLLAVNFDLVYDNSIKKDESKYLTDTIALIRDKMWDAEEPYVELTTPKFVKDLTDVAVFCDKLLKKLCHPYANSINLDVKILATFVEPLQSTIAFRVLGPDTNTRMQHGQRSHDTAVAGHAGSNIIKDLTAGDPQRLGLIKQFRRNFDDIFTAAGEFTLNFIVRALKDAIAKLDKIKYIKPLSDPAAAH